jgi:hypothetical protein
MVLSNFLDMTHRVVISWLPVAKKKPTSFSHEERTLKNLEALATTNASRSSALCWWSTCQRACVVRHASLVDAVVVASAALRGGGVVYASDLRDLRRLQVHFRPSMCSVSGIARPRRAAPDGGRPAPRRCLQGRSPIQAPRWRKRHTAPRSRAAPALSAAHLTAPPAPRTPLRQRAPRQDAAVLPDAHEAVRAEHVERRIGEIRAAWRHRVGWRGRVGLIRPGGNEHGLIWWSVACAVSSVSHACQRARPRVLPADR